ncbi:VOC family protein [Deinococcus soli (ex Cha et al. 2016)]|uniref:Catechol 2,3-dioxygenase-like lactoylglutathione lyase family enzyme n=2 Tax=Deinococcus soli (ex Cha et al. 2016) TaxID=1309411 RepID=A0AAE3X983_9DEIO|nr:VOC family protein [Deinococcus soli (ex Cha et al. 2016)]MDR6216871.1 catechol 2,3-dioxygenase-like lactoylglutathione lyase family enzyme [Deinococcus soli (ex Cha et al. 2016)]MDR6327692.1 catechol 2,3-dioxygenase-like lactoylglutathione lyase family enzyme [Deinococcus soli (ex Cha et al. 2016)]MDR6749967.1 catechol 2,3-dioxygenase-like lactoylglutathione lyase family enzyme [Deinococcus soli (ex Cha et al. 2016)]
MSGHVLGTVHTAIAISDLTHELGYWQQVLGFTLLGITEVGGPLPEQETGVPGLRSRLAMLALHGQTVELYQPLAPGGRATYRPSPADIGSWHLAFRVADLGALIRDSAPWGWQVRGQVAVVTEGPGPVGARLAYLHNADGTILEFIQLPG